MKRRRWVTKGGLKGFEQCEVCELTAEKRRGSAESSSGADSR